MSKFAIRLLTLAMFSMALVAAPLVTKVHANPDSDAPPPSSSKSKAKKKTSEVSPPSIEDAAFAKGYRAAYATIYDRNDYAAAIEQLKALGHDDSAAVANLIGYSYRKLGDYKVSQIWYERAEGRPEPRQDLAILRAVAGRTRQPRSGAISPEPDRRLGRYQQRGISLARRSTRKAARPRPRLLIFATRRCETRK